VWVLPILSLVLWAIALGAVVWFFVKRPPKTKGPLGWRLGGLGAHIAVWILVAVLWDISFKATFGTSVLTLVRDVGISFATLPRIGILAAFEALPWSVASLFFALPVRIAAGIGLRQLGKGKALAGFAKAAGLISLIAFGPIYALWISNLVLAQVFAHLPGSP
jgi:hypothetical protein